MFCPWTFRPSVFSRLDVLANVLNKTLIECLTGLLTIIGIS